MSRKVSSIHTTRTRRIFSTPLRSTETYLRITQAAKLSYSILIFKSVGYGAFVFFLAWKLQVGLAGFTPDTWDR